MHSTALLIGVTFANLQHASWLGLPLLSPWPEGIHSPLEDHGSYTNKKLRKVKHTLSYGGRSRSAANSIWRYHINTGGILCYEAVNEQSSTIAKGDYKQSHGKLQVNLKTNKEERSLLSEVCHIFCSTFATIFWSIYKQDPVIRRKATC